jgi:N-acetylmuramoyl-L-alanine amidase
MRKTFQCLLAAAVLLTAPCQASAAKVVVDAGHGGKDPGAIGVNGLQEKTVNLDIALKLKDELAKRGYDVFLTRDSDVYVSLEERVERTNEAKADLFVSVHANSHPSDAVRGVMVLYYDKDFPQPGYPPSDAMAALTPESKKLAETVLNRVATDIGLPNKGIVPSAVYVVRMGQVPSILVETAFLSNATDAALLADPAARGKIAASIAAGVAEYLPISDRFVDMAGHWAEPIVIRLKEQGIVEGDHNRFYPNRPVTRAELLTLMNRVEPFDEKPNGTAPQDGKESDRTFTDLGRDHWAYDTIEKALKLGYIDGYSDGTFRPDKPVNRSEAAAMINHKGDKPSEAVFADVATGHWAAPYIYRLKKVGLIEGTADNRFEPQKEMTRAEAAALIDRYLHNQSKNVSG